VAQREIVSALQTALDARRQRIIISRSAINWVKWTVVIMLAALIEVTIGIVHSDNRAMAAIAMTIFALGVAACLVLIWLGVLNLAGHHDRQIGRDLGAK